MTKTYSPQVESALNDAAKAPILMTCENRPNMVALDEQLFDTMVSTTGVDREACLLRSVPRPKGPTIMLVLEENFAKLRSAFIEQTKDAA